MENKKHAGDVLRTLSNLIKRHILNTSSDTEITGAQGRVLHFIIAQSQHTAIFQKDIEEEFNLRRSSATVLLQLLEKNGLIKREAVSYDARLKQITVTGKGEKIKEQVMEDIKTLEKKLLHNISQDDLEVFFKVTKQMIKNLE